MCDQRGVLETAASNQEVVVLGNLLGRLGLEIQVQSEFGVAGCELGKDACQGDFTYRGDDLYLEVTVGKFVGCYGGVVRVFQFALCGGSFQVA